MDDPCPDQTQGHYASETFHRRDDARLARFGDLARLHIDDMCTVGKSPLASKAGTLGTLKNGVDQGRIGHIDRAMQIEYGRKRAKEGTNPVTLGLRLGVIKMIITHAAAMQGSISPRTRSTKSIIVFEASCAGSIPRAPLTTLNHCFVII